MIKKSHVGPVEKDEIIQAKLGLLSLFLLCNFMNESKKEQKLKNLLECQISLLLCHAAFMSALFHFKRSGGSLQ